MHMGKLLLLFFAKCVELNDILFDMFYHYLFGEFIQHAIENNLTLLTLHWLLLVLNVLVPKTEFMVIGGENVSTKTDCKETDFNWNWMCYSNRQGKEHRCSFWHKSVGMPRIDEYSRTKRILLSPGYQIPYSNIRHFVKLSLRLFVLIPQRQWYITKTQLFHSYQTTKHISPLFNY